MAYTLLDLTQQILSSMDSDEVNSIGDTPESLQVANIVRSAWDDIVARLDLPEHYELFQLDANGNSDPTVMVRPTAVNSILWVRYDKQTVDDAVVKYLPVKFVPFDIFLQGHSDASVDDVATVTIDPDDYDLAVIGDPFTYYPFDNKAPDFYTTLDDKLLLFDSYDVAVDTTGLVASKSQAYGIIQQVFTLSDGFVPFIDQDFQILLLNEAKSLAFLELKQMEHGKAERTAQKGWIHAQKAKRGVNRDQDELSRLPNYGRNGAGWSGTFPYTKSQRSGS